MRCHCARHQQTYQGCRQPTTSVDKPHVSAILPATALQNRNAVGNIYSHYCLGAEVGKVLLVYFFLIGHVWQLWINVGVTIEPLLSFYVKIKQKYSFRPKSMYYSSSMQSKLALYFSLLNVWFLYLLRNLSYVLPCVLLVYEYDTSIYSSPKSIGFNWMSVLSCSPFVTTHVLSGFISRQHAPLLLRSRYIYCNRWCLLL